MLYYIYFVEEKKWCKCSNYMIELSSKKEIEQMREIEKEGSDLIWLTLDHSTRG